MFTIEELFESIKTIFITTNGNISLVGKIVWSIVIAFFAIVLVKLLDKVINRKLIDETIAKNNSRVGTAATVAKSFAKVFVYVLAILFILDIMGINTRSILAVAGIGGVTIAFAAQSIVKDVINGAFLLFENQYDIGDWVEIKGKSGTVISMGLRTTKLQDFAGQIHMIPNGQIDIVTNHSKNNMKAIVDIGLKNTVEVDEVLDLLENGLKEEEIFVAKPMIWGIMKVDEFSYTLRIIAIARPGNQWAAERLIRLQVISILQEHNLVNQIINIEEIRKSKDGEI